MVYSRIVTKVFVFRYFYNKPIIYKHEMVEEAFIKFLGDVSGVPKKVLSHVEVSHKWWHISSVTF